MKVFSKLAALVFLIVCVLHALRLAQHWEVVVNGAVIPMWVSWVGVVVPGIFSAALWKESRIS